MTILINIVYLVCLCLTFWYYLYKIATSEKYRAGFRERLGGVPKRNRRRPCLWLHCSSVGETLLMRQFVRRLEETFPNHEIVISTFTSTGYATARKVYPGKLVFYYPLDFTWCVRRTLRRIHPDAIILAELEVWPNFILRAARRGIPIVLVNGRITRKSFEGYLVLRFLVKRLFRRIRVFAVQNEGYAERFRLLGAPPERVQVTGNMKYDSAPMQPTDAAVISERAALKRALGITAGDKVLVGGCTHPGEDGLLLEVYQELRKADPTIRLLLVPRHAKQFAAVEKLIQSRGLTCVRKTQVDRVPEPASEAEIDPQAVILVDTIGELVKIYDLANVVFVGGSLVKHGGHNLMEPAALGKAILFGPHVWNFQDTAKALLARDAARQVRTREELFAAAQELLADPERATSMGRRGITTIVECQGATERNLEIVQRIFGGPTPAAAKEIVETKVQEPPNAERS